MTDLISTGRGWGAFLRAAATLAAVTVLSPNFVSPARAQISIWDQLQGPSYGGGANSQAPESKPEPLNDLRPDSTPWRSDVMLNAVSAAIEHYQQIVASGGWPWV